MVDMAVVTTVVAGVVAAAAAAAVVVDVVAAAAAVVVQGTRGHIRHHRQYRQAGWVDQGNPPYLLSRRCTCSSSTSGRMQAVMQQHVASELSQGTWGDHRGRMWQVFFLFFCLDARERVYSHQYMRGSLARALLTVEILPCLH